MMKQLCKNDEATSSQAESSNKTRRTAASRKYRPSTSKDSDDPLTDSSSRPRGMTATVCKYSPPTSADSDISDFNKTAIKEKPPQAVGIIKGIPARLAQMAQKAKKVLTFQQSSDQAGPSGNQPPVQTRLQTRGETSPFVWREVPQKRGRPEKGTVPPVPKQIKPIKSTDDDMSDYNVCLYYRKQ